MMGKLGIAFCITDLEIGGAERCLVQLATGLDRQRFDPVVYCLGSRPDAEEASCVPVLEGAGIEVHCLGARGIRQIFSVLERLGQLLAEQQPDLVQTFLFHANLVGRLAARRSGVRRVVSGIRVAEGRSRWPLWLDRLTEKAVDRYVCVSQAVARFSESRAGLPPEKMVVIPNGIDVTKYPSQCPVGLPSLGIRADRRVITFVGRLDRQKGVRWLIDAAEGWLSQLPDCDLLLVGKGPERGTLERRCEKRGISDRVHFAGWRNDVPDVLAASRLLLLSSQWEGMPNVVLEAMASGLPVVATDVHGVRELLGPAADAQTVSYGDSEALGYKVVRLMSDPQVATIFGAENQRRVGEEFSLARMIDAYQGLWESLVGT